MWTPVPSFAVVCVCVCTRTCVRELSHVWLLTSPSIVACQAPLSMEFPRQEYRSELQFSSSRQSFLPRGQTCVSYSGRWILYHCTTWEALATIPSSHFSPVKDRWLVVDFCRASDEEEEQSIENHRWLSFLIVYPVYLYIYKNQLMYHEGPWCH